MIQTIIDIIGSYIAITSECNFNKLGPPFKFYLADDEVHSNVYCKNPIYIDLKSAYPSISEIYFGKNSKFVKDILSKPNKFEKNVFISISLKALSIQNNNEYLTEYNIICKIIILGYIYTRFKDITVIEYIKDGAIIKYSLINSELNSHHKQFLEFINKYKLIFHEDEISSYIRINKTTILKTDELKLKGKYKNAPKYIQDIIISFLEGNIYNEQFLNSIKIIYSEAFSKLVILSGMVNEIDSFYSFNGTFLNSSGNLSTLETFDPKAYLVYIIYPILSLLRLNQKEISFSK